MIPAETVPGIRGRRIMESSCGVNLSIIYLIHCKKLCKCHNLPPPRTIINKNKNSQTHRNKEQREMNSCCLHSLSNKCIFFSLIQTYLALFLVVAAKTSTYIRFIKEMK
jgi:hypothetical protein